MGVVEVWASAPQCRWQLLLMLLRLPLLQLLVLLVLLRQSRECVAGTRGLCALAAPGKEGDVFLV